MRMYRQILLYLSAVVVVPNLGFLTDTLFCLHCNEEDDLNKCRAFISCHDDHEACFLHRIPLDHGKFTYTTGCLATTLCRNIVGVDTSGNCIQCCNSNFCNNDTQKLCSAVTTQKPTATSVLTTPTSTSTQSSSPSTTTTTTATTSTTTSATTSTAPIPCVDNPNVDCKVVAPDVCGKDDHFTYNLCRRTCGGCSHHGN